MREPAAWLEVDEGTGEVIDATLIKPEGAEPGVRYEPLFASEDEGDPEQEGDLLHCEHCLHWGTEEEHRGLCAQKGCPFK